MMEPKFFPEKNFTFTAPEGMDNCGELHVHTAIIDGYKGHVSCWQPNDEQRKQIAEGAKVWLTCHTDGHVPVSLNVGHQFTEIFKPV